MDVVASKLPNLSGDSAGQWIFGAAVGGVGSLFGTYTQWILPSAFGQSDLVRAAYQLLQGNLWLPGRAKSNAVPLCTLGTLGSLGPDRRDIHDAFSLSKKATSYPAFWGHDAQSITTISKAPNAYLSPLSKAKPGRHLRRVEDLLPLAGRVLLVERMRLNTQGLVAVNISEDVLSNVWWTFKFHKDSSRTRRLEKALTLWLNSSLGILILLSSREETQGAWVDFKKPVLSRLPVLNLHDLDKDQIGEFVKAYDRLSGQTLMPLPMMATDPIRAEIDRAISESLGLPDFSVLREMMAREPVVCLKSL